MKAGAPRIAEGGVVHAADFGDRLAPGVFASAFGSDFSLVQTNWDSAMPADGRLPEGVAGVRVRIGGRAAYPAFVSAGQVNFLIPPDLPAGRHRVELITPHGRALQEVEVADTAPAFFATMRDGKRFAAPRPVRAGETIELWACGLGASDPAAPVGAAIASPLPLAGAPEVMVAGRPAQVVYAALAYPGVCQINIRVPGDVPPGLADVQLRAGAVTSRDAVLEIAP